MGTAKRRYAITDTGDLSDLLDAAARHWPEIRDRKELLLKLAAAGRDVIENELNTRLRAVEKTAGTLSGVYESGELERLRDGWPE
jgi:hypothetical protein